MLSSFRWIMLRFSFCTRLESFFVQVTLVGILEIRIIHLLVFSSNFTCI